MTTKPELRIEPQTNVEVIPMLRDHLLSNLRSTEKEIARTEKRLAELRDKVVTLKQIAVSAGIPTDPKADPVPETPA